MKTESIYDQMTKSEKEVADLLKEFGISWAYEKPVFVWDENKRPRVWAPDFYLIPFGVYVEVCGSQSFDYDYRRRIFDNNGYKVIFLHLYKDKNKWIYHFMRYLEKIVDYKYQKLIKILSKEE